MIKSSDVLVDHNIHVWSLFGSKGAIVLVRELHALNKKGLLSPVQTPYGANT